MTRAILPLVTLADAARLLAVSERHFRNLLPDLRDHGLRELGLGRARRWSLPDLDRIARTTAGRQETIEVR